MAGIGWYGRQCGRTPTRAGEIIALLDAEESEFCRTDDKIAAVRFQSIAFGNLFDIDNRARRYAACAGHGDDFAAAAVIGGGESVRKELRMYLSCFL
jgi:hypothetical protein